MLRSTTLTTVALLFVAGSAFAQRWAEFRSDTDRFAVEFPPGGPEIRDIDYESEYRAVFPARVYSATYAGGRYSVTVARSGAA